MLQRHSQPLTHNHGESFVADEQSLRRGLLDTGLQPGALPIGLTAELGTGGNQLYIAKSLGSLQQNREAQMRLRR